MQPTEFLPLEVVFMPGWWHRHYGLSFDQSFYLDKATRLHNEQVMNQALRTRFAGMGLGDEGPAPRPIIGSRHVAGGFVMGALMGCQIEFNPDIAPGVLHANLDDAQVQALEVPDIANTWPMNVLLAQMDELQAEFGSVVGDFDLDGVLNLAFSLRGQQLFLDFRENPALARRVLDVCARAMTAVAALVKPRTGTVAVATNRMITHVEAGMFLHSNCTVQMISPQAYEAYLLAPELYLAQHLTPYGIHHCGVNMHRYTEHYARVPSVYFDVGWGSDVAACRRALPEPFFSLRLSPVRMLNATPAEVAADVEGLLRSCPSLERAGVCAINLDGRTPDDNVWAAFEVIQRYRRYGA